MSDASGERKTVSPYSLSRRVESELLLFNIGLFHSDVFIVSPLAALVYRVAQVCSLVVKDRAQREKFMTDINIILIKVVKQLTR